MLFILLTLTEVAFQVEHRWAYSISASGLKIDVFPYAIIEGLGFFYDNT